MILFVCTGNTCRSPMAEALLRHHLAAAGVDLDVASAGTIGWNSGPATEHTREVLAERGIDLDGHVSRRLDPPTASGADLIVPMTRNHAVVMANYDPTATARTFLPGEVVRLGRAIGPRGDLPLATWVARLEESRDESRRWSPVTEGVEDPLGEALDVYRATLRRLDDLTRDLASLLR